MTVELLGRAAPDPQEFLLAWLAPLGDECSTRRNPNDPLPFRMVVRVGGAGDLFSDFPLMSVHTFGATDTLASRASKVTEQRLLVLLDDPTTNVLMPDGSIANCENFEVKEAARKEHYHNTSVIRYVGRYALGLKRV
jgi:hypothetical protein